MAEAEENKRLIEPSRSGENGLDPSSTNTEDNSLSPAPDVTYDATILESQKQSPEEQQQGLGEAKDSEEKGVKEEGSAKQNDGTGGSAVQEKALEFENGGREQQAEQSGSTKEEEKEEDEWMDILGSGELKKKVPTNNIFPCLSRVFECNAMLSI